MTLLHSVRCACRLPSPDRVRHSSPQVKFGTEAQHPKFTPMFVSPGPKYLPDAPSPTIAPSYSFAPQNNSELGMSRNRSETSKMFISKAHSVNDRLGTADEPGTMSEGMLIQMLPGIPHQFCCICRFSLMRCFVERVAFLTCLHRLY